VLCSAKAETQRPPTGKSRLSKDGAPVWQFLDLSSYAEQMLVHENAIVKIDKEMPLDRAALIGCGVVTGAGAVMNTARIPAGSTVAPHRGCSCRSLERRFGWRARIGAALSRASRALRVFSLLGANVGFFRRVRDGNVRACGGGR
jgi:S-(hydroxymethyl)glutathione dehydrogenase/alcohol dehydrogenase